MLDGFNALYYVLAILGLSAIIAWHELGHYWLARRFKMKILKYSVGIGPKLFGFERGGTTYQISAIPFGGFVQIFGMTPFEEGAQQDPAAFINKPRWQRIIVYLAGPAANYILAVALYFLVFMIYPGGKIVVTEVVDGGAAQTAGLLTDDVITSINETPFRNEADFLNAISAADELVMNVERIEGESVVVKTITATPQESEGRKMLGVRYAFAFDRSVRTASVFEVLQVSVLMCVKISMGSLNAIWAKVFKGDESVQFHGPVEVTKQLKAAAAKGIPDLLIFLAFLSVALGFLNLLPVPALDGSKSLILLIESALRRDIHPTAQVYFHAVGFIALMGLIAYMSFSELFT